jgi:hypothetical protein
MPKRIIFKLIFSLFVLFQLSCKKEAIKPPDTKPTTTPYSIKVKVEDFIDGPEASWSAAKTNNFVEYKIWASFLGDSVSNNLGKGQHTFFLESRKNPMDTVLKITNPWLDGSGISVGISYYRIEAVFSNSPSVLSRNFKYTEDEIVLNETTLTAKHSPSADEIYLLGINGNKFHVFNTVSKKFTSNLTTSNALDAPFYFNPILELNINATVREAFIVHNRFVEIIDLKTRKILAKVDLKTATDETILSASSNNNGLLYLSSDRNNLIVLDRGNNNELTKSLGIGINSSSYCYYQIPNENNLLAIEGGGSVFASAAIVKLNSTKKAIESTEKKVITQSGCSNVNFIIDNNTFSIGQAGFIYDRQLNFLGQISSKLNNFIVLEDVKKIDANSFYAINYNLIGKYSLNSTFLQEKRTIEGLPICIAPMNNEIWTVRRSSVDIYKTFISKLKK